MQLNWRRLSPSWTAEARAVSLTSRGINDIAGRIGSTMIGRRGSAENSFLTMSHQ